MKILRFSHKISPEPASMSENQGMPVTCNFWNSFSFTDFERNLSAYRANENTVGVEDSFFEENQTN